MFRKTVAKVQVVQDQQLEIGGKLETTLCRLQALKNDIQELRCQCEELVKQRLVDKDNVFVCSECGLIIEPNQEIVYKDSVGTEEHYYHRTCFREMLISLDS